MEEPKGILKELLGWISVYRGYYRVDMADYNVCRAAYTSKRALYGGNFT
mgnify:CR=1 FL=1